MTPKRSSTGRLPPKLKFEQPLRLIIGRRTVLYRTVCRMFEKNSMCQFHMSQRTVLTGSCWRALDMALRKQAYSVVSVSWCHTTSKILSIEFK
jgi:hypothetical protein